MDQLTDEDLTAMRKDFRELDEAVGAGPSAVTIALDELAALRAQQVRVKALETAFNEALEAVHPEDMEAFAWEINQPFADRHARHLQMWLSDRLHRRYRGVLKGKAS